MEILCRLRPVNLVENKCIGIVFSRGDVKRFHTRLRPHQRQVLACGLDKLRAVLRLNFCFDQHDHFFVRHYWTAPLDFHWLADFPPAPPTARAAQMRLRPSALPPSRFAWFSSVIPFVTCHSTPRHTIRVRQNVANTCANHCNQAITIKNGDWQLDIGRITAIVKPTAVNCFWRLIDGVDAESSRSRCRLRVKRLRRVYPRTKGYSCVIGFVEELQRFGSECGQKAGSYQYERALPQLRGLFPSPPSRSHPTRLYGAMQ